MYLILTISFFFVIYGSYWMGYSSCQKYGEKSLWSALSRAEKAIENAECERDRSRASRDLRCKYLLEFLEKEYGKDSKQYNDFLNSIKEIDTSYG